ncbi:class I SAM-dependent methyltransferase [Leptolyngbya sp. AN03gr2]|uniref:class I SAM-dependent methyltransferase n=1 Tax=unclassified Leptolyngbya TaxID=2650499 RepID=UPI003D323CEA
MQLSSSTQSNIVGYSAEAYRQRENGYSPEPIRDRLWSLVGDQVAGTVLDAGSGSGGWLKRLQQRSSIDKLISVDIVDDGASQIETVEFHIRDLSTTVLPCADQSIDWIFAIEVMEHLANPRHFVQEAKRSLKPGGKLVITTPNNDSLRSRISFLLRGYYPAFCEHDYQVAGHITPILEVDLQRMATEAKFSDIGFFYPLPGQIPGLSVKWQSLLPKLQGKAWSDSLFAILTA